MKELKYEFSIFTTKVQLNGYDLNHLLIVAKDQLCRVHYQKVYYHRWYQKSFAGQVLYQYEYYCQVLLGFFLKIRKTSVKVSILSEPFLN